MDPWGLMLKVTVVLAGAVLVLWATRTRAATTRHLLWTTTFIALLGLPAAVQWLPALDLSVMAASFGLGTRGSGAGATGTWAASAPVLWGVWATGSGVALTSLCVGWWRFSMWAREGQLVDDPEWLGVVDALRGRLGIGRPVDLVVSARASVPMAGGVVKPVIVLPPSALEWSPSRRVAVLSHELIHVRRHDALRQLLCGVTLALYWFHPLSWMAARYAALSREQACDEGVLALGARPSEYAAELLDLAQRAPERLRSAGPVPMPLALVERSQLERRIAAILDPRRPHPRRQQALLLAALLVLGAVTTAVAVPSQAPPPCEWKNPIPE